ncbi:hypothetical protein CK203_044114 [Vitis vinifera]|uniref:DUF659 domain-containing protein n=1 Tax=Vitis vinifera TaxID=29760 RepID=A0A438HM68_VITVI|nr:hypothetical protein CK203_044114 [Vitis vinifera]
MHRRVNRLKHHLAGTHHGMKPCNKVSEDARLECKEALANFKDKKTKRNELLQEIGMGPTSMHESALSKIIGTLGSGNGSVVEVIGEEIVVQVITDNASNYVNAGMRLMEKMRKLWTPCAAHCIDLMLEDIGKLNVHATTLLLARQVAKFIYGHTWVLSLMRTFTKNHEFLRPAITRFATAFLTLQSLYKQKQALIAMFSSEKWCSSTWAKKVEEEIDLDDEWIEEKEDPLLPLDLCWLQDNELFSVDAIRVVSSNSQETETSSDHMVSSHSYKRKHNEVPSTSGGKGKEKELNLTPIDEDKIYMKWGYMIVDIFLLLIHWMRMMMTLEMRI